MQTNATNTRPIRGKFNRKLLPSSITYYPSQGITLIGNGAWRDAICPFHEDKTPSMRVNIESGGYRCMVCGARGDLLSFHQHKNNLNFVEACISLGAWEILQ